MYVVRGSLLCKPQEWVELARTTNKEKAAQMAREFVDTFRDEGAAGSVVDGDVNVYFVTCGKDYTGPLKGRWNVGLA